MKINIPENHRQQFEKAIEYAVSAQSFTPSELAAHLGTGEFSASIMVGYLEKAEIVTKAKGNDTRTARISPEKWRAIGCKLDGYEPEEVKEIYEPPTIEIEKPVYSIDTSELVFKGKTLDFEENCFILTDSESSFRINADDINSIYIHRGGLFKKSTLTLSTQSKAPAKPKNRADTLVFAARDYAKIYAFAQNAARELQIQVKEF